MTLAPMVQSGAGANLPTRAVWIAINGILSRPGDAEGWTDRAVTWLHLHTEVRAEKFEYAAGALTRRLRQSARVKAIARMIGHYHRGGFRVTLLGHSNGAELVAQVLGRIWPIEIEAAHLVAPATEGDELRRALASGQLGWLHLYGSRNDGPLRLAKVSAQLGGWAGLGYGDLGRRVEHFATLANRTTAHNDDTQGHSSWWTRGDSFERTMRLLTQHIRPQ